MFARSAFRLLREKMDPRKVNGGVFLGLNGVVIKSHGGTDAEGFASAIDLAREMARAGLLRLIAEDRVVSASQDEVALSPVRMATA
jgi:glycerol-3-phosphate acyltransferase PlsX